MKKGALTYGVLAAVIVLFDQLTKWYARTHWVHEYTVTNHLSFQLTLNRGISWGLFNGSHNGLFWVITLLIMVLTAALGLYGYTRVKQGCSIFGELFVVAGSCSNIIDRFMHAGVIDFIVLHKGDLAWPVFNLADVFIVIGVATLFVQQIIFSECSKT